MNYRMFTLTCKMWNNETVNQNVREREYSHLYSRPRQKRDQQDTIPTKKGIVRMEKKCSNLVLQCRIDSGNPVFPEQSISAWQKGNKVHMRHGTAFYVPFWWYVYWERLHDTRSSFVDNT